MYLKPLLLGKQQQQRLTHIPRLSIISVHMYVCMYVCAPSYSRHAKVHVCTKVCELCIFLRPLHVPCTCTWWEGPTSEEGDEKLKVLRAGVRKKLQFFCLFVSVLFRFLRYLQFDTIFADVSDVSGGSQVRNLEVLIGLHSSEDVYYRFPVLW